MNEFAVSGVNCAVATALDADLAPDLASFGAHCRDLLANGCDGLAILGTTGEANSFTVAERKSILEGALAAGVPAERLLPGTGVAAYPDTIELTRHALSLGVERVVMLPPFYYKAPSDQGLIDSYSRIVEGVGDARLKVILYHIPQTSAVPIPHDVIEALRQKFPGTFIGIKDSSGDFDNMAAMVKRFPGLAVLAGADPLLLPLLKLGGAGCITAAANLIPGELAKVYTGYADDDRQAEVDAAQARIVAVRALTTGPQQIANIKAALALVTGNAGWRRVRPPLVAADDVMTARIAGSGLLAVQQ
ncbi:MAG: 4-hydroxy-tetrahydrodipicolinate synthase [Hyphomicrobiales bacterium]|nr:4-hydroxy-tetrahydrodipicolinate synthase [Hyphomicrobiales bacterium]